MGEINTTLDRQGEPSVYGSTTKTTSTPTVVIPTNAPVYTKPVTLDPAHLARRTAGLAPNPAEVIPEPKLEGRQLNVAGLFSTPIAITTPPQIFSRRATHPVPRNLIVDSVDLPAQTNKFYTNLYMPGQTEPAYTSPYAVYYLQGPQWGLGITHTDVDERTYGPTNAPGGPGNGAIQYYLSRSHISQLNLGFTEYINYTSSMEMSQLGEFSANMDLYKNKAVSSSLRMRVPLCLGMGFVSAEYSGLTPKVESQLLFRNVALVPAPRVGVVKYKALLEDGKTWLIYAHPNGTASGNFTLTLVNNGKLEAAAPFFGTIQIAKLDNGLLTPSAAAAMETMLDQTTGAWCVGATKDAQTTGTVGTYQIMYTRKGTSTSGLLMWSLPHHYNSFEASTAGTIRAGLEMWSQANGKMRPVVSDTWRMSEANLIPSDRFLPG